MTIPKDKNLIGPIISKKIRHWEEIMISSEYLLYATPIDEIDLPALAVTLLKNNGILRASELLDININDLRKTCLFSEKIGQIVKDKIDELEITLILKERPLTIKHLRFSQEVLGTLWRGGIKSIRQLLGFSIQELKTIHHLGKRRMIELEFVLKKFNLDLKPCKDSDKIFNESWFTDGQKWIYKLNKKKLPADENK